MRKLPLFLLAILFTSEVAAQAPVYPIAPWFGSVVWKFSDGSVGVHPSLVNEYPAYSPGLPPRPSYYDPLPVGSPLPPTPAPPPVHVVPPLGLPPGVGRIF